MIQKSLLMGILLLCCCIRAVAQTVKIEVDIEDEYLKMPLSGVKLSVLTPDSAVVVDSASCFSIRSSSGQALKEIYTASVKAGRHYLLRATRVGYGDVWRRFSVPSTQKGDLSLSTLMMRKEWKKELDEVVVKATKVKMYYKGDTIVYDADAFKLPDGSMLQSLIDQLPGVTMNQSGEIFVNGRKVDELMLGSRTFMHGNKKVLMENLPYYTVKNIKVYDKQTDKSVALGYDVEPRKFVMDVNLKPEYSQGYIANVEAAGGTNDRWLGRGFLLGFTDLWRYSVMANLNNVNEGRHIGERGFWSPATMPRSLTTTRSVAFDLDYQSKDKVRKNNFVADYTSTSDDREMRRRQEQFLEGSHPLSQTENTDHSGNWKVKLSNEYVATKPGYLQINTNFNYEKRHANGHSLFNQWDDLQSDTLTASMFTDNLSEGHTLHFDQSVMGAFNTNKEKERNLNYYLSYWYTDEKSWLSDCYNTWQANTQTKDVRYNASDRANRSSIVYGALTYSVPELIGKMGMSVGTSVNYGDVRKHDYLYHPDTLLLASQLDMLNAITDPANSYDSHVYGVRVEPNITFSKGKYYQVGDNPIRIHYDQWRVGVSVPILHDALDYQRGVIDTTVYRHTALLSPYVSFRTVSPGGNHSFSVNLRYDLKDVDFYDWVNYRDDSQPLVVKLGNPDLKKKANTMVSVDYTDRWGKNERQWHIAATYNYQHRDVAQSVNYNPETGVYTYKPVNVDGAYSGTAKFDYSQALGEKKYWRWQMNADANYRHSVDYAMLAGETESHRNIVNTTTLHDGAYIQYSKGMLNLRASGDVSWRHSVGRMYDFETLNVWDFNYGLSGRYTIPKLKTTVALDATMYSRRGYGSSELNTNDFLLNASLSQSFWKGKIIARLEAFDLLHNLSATQYEVNAQGRVETWYRSLPHYVMLHLVYHWNKNPKKL